jgi:hypothetical protein
MSISSVFLGILASCFAINGAGNLKEAFNKKYEDFSKSSIVNDKSKWFLNVCTKFAATSGSTLVAIESFTGGILKTAALQSVIDMVGGKLPRSGEKMSEIFSQAGTEISSPFISLKNNIMGNKKAENPVKKTVTNKQQNLTNTESENGAKVETENSLIVKEVAEKPISIVETSEKAKAK